MDRSDFEEFPSSTGTTFAREAYLICGADRSAAEDAVQEALTKAYVRWGHISGLSNPSGYVRRMVINECLTTRRRWRRRHESHTPMVQGHVVGGFEPVEDRAVLGQLLAQLGPRQRAVLVLRYFCDMPDPQIAEVLGCSPANVRSQASRALASLRRSTSTSTPEGTRHVT
jgi:RNA polymerase sigma-70 factor (sigma-E family)